MVVVPAGKFPTATLKCAFVMTLSLRAISVVER